MSSDEEYRALAERLAAKAALCQPKEFNVSFDEGVELGLLCDRHRQHSWPCPESALLREASAALKSLRERTADENGLVVRVEGVRTHLMDVMSAARTVDPKMHMILWAINDELRAALSATAVPAVES